MLDYWSRSKRFLRNLCEKTKGSLKTPCICMGVAAVFLFVLVSLGSGPLLKSLADKGDFYFADMSKILNSQGADEPVIGSSTMKKLSPESPQFIMVENSTLLASTPPTTFSSQVLGSLVAGYQAEESKSVITEYVVKEEDTLWSLAEKFNISLSTILWANDLTEKSIIKPGQKLVIPPVSGTVHIIKSGDSISKIAQTYKAKKEEIVAFNELDDEDDIYVGDVLVVPGGTMPARQQQVPASIPLAESRFTVPVYSPYIITQGGHGYYDRYYGYTAVDFSHAGYACGKYVIAAAGGTVQRTGYDRIAGYYVRISHPHLNGAVTFYGHLSKIFVSAGQQVGVGEEIGLMGNTGYTIGRTGCHLHFEVRGAANPFVR
jgi:murein DD-endopeptidase MepM/ murein hydrolase activator NlpD